MMDELEAEGAWTLVERRKPKPDPPVDPPSLTSAPSSREGVSDKRKPKHTSWSGPSRDTAVKEQDVPTTPSPSQKDNEPRAGQRGVIVLKKPLPPSDRSNAAEWPVLQRDSPASGDSPAVSYSAALKSAPRPSRPQAHPEQVGGVGWGGVV